MRSGVAVPGVSIEMTSAMLAGSTATTPTTAVRTPGVAVGGRDRIRQGMVVEVVEVGVAGEVTADPEVGPSAQTRTDTGGRPPGIRGRAEVVRRTTAIGEGPGASPPEDGKTATSRKCPINSFIGLNVVQGETSFFGTISYCILCRLLNLSSF